MIKYVQTRVTTPKTKYVQKRKEKNQINNTAKFNGSFVNESDVNYFENERTEVS